jgi:hypothetical protein
MDSRGRELRRLTMTRSTTCVVVAALAVVLGRAPEAALAQAAAPPAKPQAAAPAKPAAQTPAKPAGPARKPTAPAPRPGEARFRLVLNFAAQPGSISYDDVRTPIAYAEPSTIRTSYDAGTGIGAGGALQASFYRGLGVLVGYSYLSRNTTGSVDVTRPHPLYLNQPRTATADLSGGSYSEGAFDVDAAYARSAGAVDWALFGGVTFFKVKADLLDVPTFDEQYPYDTLTILTTPTIAVQQNATGWNIGGRLDYRFGQSRRIGVGVQASYSRASVELTAAQASTPATIDAGGLSLGGGLRIYF